MMESQTSQASLQRGGQPGISVQIHDEESENPGAQQLIRRLNRRAYIRGPYDGKNRQIDSIGGKIGGVKRIPGE
jgi:hypothetical protein